MAFTATQFRPSTSAPGDGSRTLTITDAAPREESEGDESFVNSDGEPVVGTLRLRGSHKKTRQRVAWDEDVIDNEGCGKKKSKICCIYHKPRRFDESSDEESSDSGDDSDSSCGRKGHTHNRNHNHHSGENGYDSAPLRPSTSSTTTQIHELEEDFEPNAYEVMPEPRKGKRKAV